MLTDRQSAEIDRTCAHVAKRALTAMSLKGVPRLMLQELTMAMKELAFLATSIKAWTKD